MNRKDCVSPEYSTTKELKPLPYYAWFWQDWRANRKVRGLSYIAKGLYRELLDEQWSEGSIPNDIEELADICGCPVRVMRKHWPQLSQFFEKQEDGTLINSRLEVERTDKDRGRVSKARAGKLGGLSKSRQILAIPELQTLTEGRGRAGEPQGNAEGRLSKAEGTAAQVNENTEPIPSPCLANAQHVPYRREEKRKEEERRAEKDSSLSLIVEVGGQKLAVNLARELTHLSGSELAFADKQKIRLAVVLEEFTAAEIISAFKTWFNKQDMSVPRTVQWGAYDFVQIADQLADDVRRTAAKKAADKIKRDTHALKMTQDAELERQEAKAKREAEEALLAQDDPFAGEYNLPVQ